MTAVRRQRCFYEVLGVEDGASNSDIKKAYYTKALRLHPDRTKDGGREFREVSEAYETLSCPTKRPLYDIDRSSARQWDSDTRGSWTRAAKDKTRKKRSSSWYEKASVFERLLSPRSLGLFVVALFVVFLTSPRQEKKYSTDVDVDGCWRDPKLNNKWVPPAPWDPDYEAALKAGAVRSLKRSQLR